MPREGFRQDVTEQDYALLWNAVGLAGEVGEVVELVKKYVFHWQELDKAKFAAELGDVLWYLTALCSVMGLDLEQVMEQNIVKLERRHPDGFDRSRASGGENFNG